MRRQKTMSQMKKQNSKKELNKLETSNVSDAEVKNSGNKDAQ